MRTSALVASAAAALFLSGAVVPALAASDSGTTNKIRCEGVNSCRNQSDCKTAHSQCKGHNGCKGQGFKLLTPEECAAAKKALEKK
jgi:uncharacterized membrane protein